VGLTGTAATAEEHKESNAGQYCSDSPNDSRDTDDWQNRGRNEGCDAHDNEQDTDSYHNLLLSVLIPRLFDQISEMQSTIYYASCAIEYQNDACCTRKVAADENQEGKSRARVEYFDETARIPPSPHLGRIPHGRTWRAVRGPLAQAVRIMSPPGPAPRVCFIGSCHTSELNRSKKKGRGTVCGFAYFLSSNASRVSFCLSEPGSTRAEGRIGDNTASP
jgi:hypothetical protein